ncbi:MAG: hypothetical protein PWR10_1805 [Halanaerobiales bacterium]|nr:hypothetical protein [Halanaerobiales bacterium]
MNWTTIEWTDFTWNPVVGCKHGCPYCYAKRFAERGLGEYGKYKKGKRFQPRFFPGRLDEPKQRKRPAKIFVSSMGDLFGDWVPDEWIEAVLDIVRGCPQHTFQFLTKNPDRYYNWFTFDMKNIPDNIWIGAGADNATDAHTRSGTLGFMGAKVKFLSLEPLLENVVEYVEWESLDWVIVGAQTGPGAKKPKKEWVENIISYCRAYDIPVFLKDNLEWPEKIKRGANEQCTAQTAGKKYISLKNILGLRMAYVSPAAMKYQ